MRDYGSSSERRCGATVTRSVAWEGTLGANAQRPQRGRRNTVSSRAARRLFELADAANSITERCEIAADFSHEMDAIFTHVVRPPRSHLRHLIARYDRLVHEDLIPRLATEGVTFPRWPELTSLERIQMQRRFHERTFPLFSPMAVDSTHPLPPIPSLALNVALLVDGRLVLVTMSPHVPRLLAVRRGRYLTVESFVEALLPELLVGVGIAGHTAFRITRSAVSDRPVRLEVERGSSGRLVDMLAARLRMAESDVYPLHSSLAMGDALAVEIARRLPGRPAAGSARRMRTERSR